MNRNRVLLLFGLLIITTAWSQEKDLRGRIISGTVGVPDVHVMNISASRATISNNEGYFGITASRGDTIMFSAVQFTRKSLVISEEMLKSALVLVPMEEMVTQLDEVILLPYDLSGDLFRDVGRVNTGQVVSASTLGLPNAFIYYPTQTERLIFEATTGGGIVPLNPILNAITGRTRYLKSLLAVEKQYARTNRVRAFYPDSIFVRELGIPIQQIDDFMYYCEVDEQFNELVDSRDRLKIWEFLVAKSRSYRKNNAVD